LFLVRHAIRGKAEDLRALSSNNTCYRRAYHRAINPVTDERVDVEAVEGVGARAAGGRPTTSWTRAGRPRFGTDHRRVPVGNPISGATMIPPVTLSMARYGPIRTLAGAIFVLYAVADTARDVQVAVWIRADGDV